MQNYPEDLWASAKKAYNVSESLEPQMKIIFLQGMYAGHQLGMQSTKLSDRVCVEFNTNLLDFLKQSLAQLGHKPCHINLNTSRIINGHPRG